MWASLRALPPEQDGASWNKAIIPKARGAWHLHEATMGMKQCEQFVVFSSIVSSIGHQGARTPRRLFWLPPQPAWSMRHFCARCTACTAPLCCVLPAQPG